MLEKQLQVAPREVYDFLKVIWPTYGTDKNEYNLSTIAYTLADPDSTRWMSENIEFGDDEQLLLLEEKYDWTVGEELPEWLEDTKNRLLLIKELLEITL